MLNSLLATESEEKLMSLSVFNKRDVEDIDLSGTETYASHSVGQCPDHRSAGFLQKRESIMIFS